MNAKKVRVRKMRRQGIPESLWPMLEVRREGWQTVRGTDNSGSVYSILLQYRGLNQYTLSVDFVGRYGIRPFMVGHQGLDYGYYDSVEEAIEVVEQLFPKVEGASHWDEIAGVRDNNFRRFIDRHGVGPKMVTRLAEAFPTLEQLCNATVVDVEKVSGIGKRTAQFIVRHFNQYAEWIKEAEQ